MKKLILYASLLLVLVVGSFWAGSWYSQRETSKVNPSGIKSTPVNADRKPDTDTGTSTSSLSPGAVKISLEKQQLIGVTT